MITDRYTRAALAIVGVLIVTAIIATFNRIDKIALIGILATVPPLGLGIVYYHSARQIRDKLDRNRAEMSRAHRQAMRIEALYAMHGARLRQRRHLRSVK